MRTLENILFNAIKNGQEEIKSVYELWLEAGNTGTLEEFMESLKGTSATVVKDVTILAEDWVESDGIYKATIANEAITSDSVVNVSINPTYIQTAVSSGVLGYTSSLDGSFEMYSNFKPSSDMIINYSIIV